jgi:hypothetical protein
MKHGKSIQELAVEVSRQNKVKRDFLPQVKEIRAFEHESNLNLGFDLDGKELFTAPLTNNGHQNLSDLTAIPKKYYERMMQGHPGLLAKNVQHWLERGSDRRMIRTLDGNIRAILSDKYRRLDNYDLLNLILPLLNDAKVEIDSCEITETRLYIKGFTHKVEGEVKPGDVVKAGVLIQNSEVGKGVLAIKPLMYRLVCRNGAVIDDLAMEKYHIGRSADTNLIEFKQDTNIAIDKAFWLQCRDTINQSMSQVTFDKVIEQVKLGTKLKIDDPMKSIELVSSKFSFAESEKTDVIKHLIEGNDLSSWGLGNAVTRMAQDVESYDRSTELESIGFKIMNQNWN